MSNPPPLNYATPPGGPNLRDIATKQKGIILCILAEIVIFVLQFFIPLGLRPILGLVYLCAAIAATVFIFMLATTIYSTGVGVVLGILTLIPLIGLIVLLIVNGKATNILKEHGIHVGLLGANLKSVPPN
jgi:hypothetical protein